MKLTTAIAALTLIASSAAVFAEPATQMGADRAALQANRKAIIMRAMNLDDKSSKTFWPLYDQFQKAKQGQADKAISVIKSTPKIINLSLMKRRLNSPIAG